MPYHLAIAQYDGGEWIRTTEPEGADLQSAAFSQTSLLLHNSNCRYRPNYYTRFFSFAQGVPRIF